MNDATDIIESILSTLPLNEKGTGASPKYEYTGGMVAIDTKTAKACIKSFMDARPVKIPPGSRYDTSLKYGGLLWACGYPAEDIKKRLVKFDKDRNSPPKNNTVDIDKIVAFLITTPQGFRERKKISTATEPQISTPAILEKAREEYESGGFIKYCETAFGKMWTGDAHILKGILLTAANMRVANAFDGIHLHISGKTQAGKSDSVKAAMRFIHPSNQLVKTFSPKYLFYAKEELREKTIMFSDDTTFDPETAAVYRNMLTSWFTGVTRGVVANHEGLNLDIPARVSLVLTSVDNVVLVSEDGQDESRFMTLEVRRTPDEKKKIRAFIQKRHPDIQHELMVVRAVWDLIIPRDVTVHKKIEKDIPIREFKRYLTLLQAHALLCNRTTTTAADITAVDKFITYSKPMIDDQTPAFTRKEAAVRSVLTVNNKTVGEISQETGMTIMAVYRALRGRDGTFQNPKGGLMAKEPKLEYSHQSFPGTNDIHSVRVRV